MPSKATKILSTTLLSVAATGLAVKTIVTGPVAAAVQGPVNDAKGQLPAELEQAVLQPATSLSLPDAASTTSVRGSLHLPAPTSTKLAARSLSSRTADDPKYLRRPYTSVLVRNVLHDAAVRHGLDPRLILALSYWESGWDQSRVSETGAIGVMQVQPDTAAEAGPALLGHRVELTDLYDNADVGSAIFRQYLDAFGDPADALAAYYQGPTSLRANGMLPDTQTYVQGILDLASRMTS